MTEQTLFAEALERTDPQERAGYLDQACQGDLALRQRIERLIVQHQHAGDFLASPAGPMAPTIDAPATERLGTQIGPYKLLQQIGEGGMGTVYMAEQSQPIQRKVALKIIKAGMDSKQVIARFEAERQALAMMDHVNIARVFDGGTTGEVRSEEEISSTPHSALRTPHSGRPYFVMELVHGVPITKYCDDNHLTPRQRLELFVPVCQAIQHAHQKGIIHRDIKPSNVMVTLYDGKPVPKVIDFGVAKATEQKLTERTLFTQYGTMVGTLEYMSPEQAEMSALGVDTRSDIYSLGVLLYELLTGSTPLSHKTMKEAAYGEILRMIKEDEPPKPSTRLSDSGEALASISAMRQTEPAKLSKLMRGELDWIVMKTLEKDRSRRYETANAFAADVQRYLSDETVQACPPSSLYRLRKFARRNRGGLVTVAILAAALVMGTAISMWLAVRADAERERATAAAKEAGEEREKAMAAAETARAAKELAEIRLRQVTRANDILGSVFQQLNIRSESADGPPLRARLAEELDRAAGQIEGEATGDPLAVARLQQILADTQFDLAYPHRALPLLSKAADTREAILGPDHPDTLWSKRRLAAVLRALGNRDKAFGMFQAIVERRKATQGPDHTDTLTSMVDFALAHRGTRREMEGIRLAEHVYEVRKAKGGADSELASDTLFTMALLYVDVGQAAKALPMFEQVLENRRMRFGVDSPQAANLLTSVGFACALTGQHRRAAVLFEESLIRFRTVYGVHHEGTFIAAWRLGLSAQALRNGGQLDDAEKAFRAALEEYEVFVAFPTQHLPPRYIKALAELPGLRANLVQLLKNAGRGAEADAVARRALAYSETLAATKPDMPEARLLTAQAHVLLGQYAKALEIYLATLERWPTPAHLNTLAWLLAASPDEKVRDPKRAMELARKAVEGAPKSAIAWQTLGWIQYRTGNWMASIEALEKSCNLQKGGDCGQWTVLALAHARIAAQESLPATERERHKVEAHRWFEKADKLVDGLWPVRAGHDTGQAIWDFRAEARELMGMKQK